MVQRRSELLRKRTVAEAQCRVLGQLLGVQVPLLRARSMATRLQQRTPRAFTCTKYGNAPGSASNIPSNPMAQTHTQVAETPKLSFWALAPAAAGAAALLVEHSHYACRTRRHGRAGHLVSLRSRLRGLVWTADAEQRLCAAAHSAVGAVMAVSLSIEDEIVVKKRLLTQTTVARLNADPPLKKVAKRCAWLPLRAPLRVVG